MVFTAIGYVYRTVLVELPRLFGNGVKLPPGGEERGREEERERGREGEREEGGVREEK